MPRNVLPDLSAYAPGLEAEAVKQFRDQSDSLKEMRKIVQNTKSEQKSQMLAIVQGIDHATTVAQLFRETEKCDFKNSDDPTVKLLGPTGMKLTMGFLGWIDDFPKFISNVNRFRVQLEQQTQKKHLNPTNSPAMLR